jgi:hypothetical protein
MGAVRVSKRPRHIGGDAKAVEPIAVRLFDRVVEDLIVASGSNPPWMTYAASAEMILSEVRVISASTSTASAVRLARTASPSVPDATYQQRS